MRDLDTTTLSRIDDKHVFKPEHYSGDLPNTEYVWVDLSNPNTPFIGNYAEHDYSEERIEDTADLHRTPRAKQYP